jgi:hypothetical protein
MKVHPHIFCCVRFHVDAVPVVGMVVAAAAFELIET